MSCKVKKTGSTYYIRYAAGTPYVFCGEATPTLCQSGPITNDFTITFIDEAHPLYVVGSGNVGGSWGPDICYYNEHLPNHPSCANILFDVDTSFVARGYYQNVPIEEYFNAKGSNDPFYVIPTGINSSNLTDCYSPLPNANIVEIARPSGGIESNGSVAIGTISQEAFATGIKNSIENIWGSDFWNRMADANGTHKLWIIRESGLSMGTGVIQSGIDLFTTYLDTTHPNLDYQEYLSTCGDNDRYLGWIVNCVSGQGSNASCTETFQLTNILENNIQGSGSDTDPGSTNKLVIMSLEGYTSSGGGQFGDLYDVTIDDAIDGTTVWTNNSWEQYGFLGTYREYYSSLNFKYTVSVQLIFENGVHKAIVDAQCFIDGNGNSNNTVWKCIVPIDKYGLPNGKLEPESIPITENYQVALCPGDQNYVNNDYSDYSPAEGDIECCTPRFPDIVFTSYPSEAFIASLNSSCPLIDFVNYTTDCTSINP
jgi:hypothetical protein